MSLKSPALESTLVTTGAIEEAGQNQIKVTINVIPFIRMAFISKTENDKW